MSRRPLSPALRRQLFTPYRDQDMRVLLTMEHDDWDEPYRFVSGDPTELGPSLTSNGNEFITIPFDVVLPNEGDSEPSCTLRIQNADDRIGSTVRNLSSEAIRVRIQVVMRTTPDVIERDARGFALIDVVEDAMMVAGRLVLRGALGEPCPGRPLSPRMSPGLFW